MTEATCRICGTRNGHQRFQAREMMFGFRDSFEYFQCKACKCLQIADIPQNIARYYPPGYVPHGALPPVQRRRSAFTQALARRRNEAALLGRGVAGRLLNRVFPMDPGEMAKVNEMVSLDHAAGRKLTFKSRILDVGCASGAFLGFLSRLGFEDLLGIDPFIEGDITHGPGARVLKKSIHDVQGTFDLIMLHHSFEHVPDPLAVLCAVRRNLAGDGLCVVRIPVVSSYAWEKYGVNWVQLDAPRHFFLHSVESMKMVAARAELAVEGIIWDSTEFQFWGSELYLKDIPLMDESLSQRFYSLFPREQVEAYRAQARALNAQQRGDQAAFYLAKPK